MIVDIQDANHHLAMVDGEKLAKIVKDLPEEMRNARLQLVVLQKLSESLGVKSSSARNECAE